MNKPFIPYEKLSKKQQRAVDHEQRGTWGAISPVTKRPERSDAYKRHKEKVNMLRTRRWNDDHSGGISFFGRQQLDCNVNAHQMQIPFY